MVGFINRLNMLKRLRDGILIEDLHFYNPCPHNAVFPGIETVREREREREREGEERESERERGGGGRRIGKVKLAKGKIPVFFLFPQPNHLVKTKFTHSDLLKFCLNGHLNNSTY